MKLTSNNEHRTSNTERPVRSPHSMLGVGGSMFDVPRSAAPQLSTFNSQPAERGIALVITLILLSVTLFMAVAFLAISRRERGSVVTQTDNVMARLAADSALANAEAQILATVLQTTNPYNFSLLVSTNYINANGFVSGLANPTNVNYIYPNGTPLLPPDFNQNVANLFYLPRAPVFAYDRPTGSNEFRFYLDLNRNRQFDANGPVPQIGQNGGFLHPNGFEDNSAVNVLTNFLLGDPEWIGVLERPDLPHGPNNKFLSRYAFIAMPAGNTLDLNAIHNAASSQNVNTPAGGNDGFLRNQGVGSWEINLAAFLADLNTNEWGAVIGSPLNGNQTYYWYNFSTSPFANRGRAFDDARALLAYRYDHSYLTLASFTLLFPNYPAGGGAVDMFPFGPLMTTPTVPYYNYIRNFSWPGADNTNRYFALASDLYDTTKITAPSLNFIDRLQFASTNVSTYDRYTFYRMLAQLGTDSAPESGKMNLNYWNVDASGNVIPDRQTNCIPWEPVEFFTNAVDRMLRTYTTKWFQASPSNYLATFYNIHINYYYTDVNGNVHTNDPTALGLVNIPIFGLTNNIPSFGVTNIPVYQNGAFVYTPAVQRVLQLAANLYDATTNRSALLGKDYPSVFRPTFYKDSFTGDVLINGYEEISPRFSALNPGTAPLDTPVEVTSLPNGFSAGRLNPLNNVYGVPWIIGSKKGFPSFNEIAMESILKVTRKLQVTRDAISATPTMLYTNEMYVFSISNSIGVEFWNPYTNNYVDAPIRVVVNGGVTMNLSNANNTFPHYYPLSQDLSFNVWPGSIWRADGTLDTRQVNFSFPTNAMYIPITANIGYMTNEVYQWGTGGFWPAGSASWETGITDLRPLPQLNLDTTNRWQAFILSGGHIIDYVHFNGPDSHRNLSAEIATNTSTIGYDSMWATNYTTRNIPYGIASQIDASLKTITPDPVYWGDVNLAKAEIDGFAVFLGNATAQSLPIPLPSGYAAVFSSYTNSLTAQVPFTPQITAYEYTTWQANDPLVHTLASDLTFSASDTTPPTGLNVSHKLNPAITLLPNIGDLNDKYQPWGKVRKYADSINNAFDTSLKDPLVRRSDNWAFPTNQLPSVGWLGRIHRGTPWQTVYLKATNLLTMGSSTINGYGTWKHWTGNQNVFDTTNTAPVQDRVLFDLFSTAMNDNASRGQLPINVGAADPGNPVAGLAAWSALFSGIVVPTNLTGIAPLVIAPAGPEMSGKSPLYAIVTNINYLRAQFTNNTTSQGGAFKRVGDILSVAKLSQSSPFLIGVSTNVITDALMEWLPQQTMGLLRVSEQPRFVIYSYGQTLTPSANGVVTSGGLAGMITNYQVTAETVTRSVVRIEGAPTNTQIKVESYNILPPD